MLVSVLLTAPLLLASAIASPWGGPLPGLRDGGKCLNGSQVQTLLDGYTYLLRFPQGANFDATANQILSDSFFVSSDSINSLAGIPVRSSPSGPLSRHRTNSFPARRECVPKQKSLHCWPSADSCYSHPRNAGELLFMQSNRLEVEWLLDRIQQVLGQGYNHHGCRCGHDPDQRRLFRVQHGGMVRRYWQSRMQQIMKQAAA